MTPDEEAACQALARALVALPRAIDADLVRSTNVTWNEYTVLHTLATAPGLTRRVSDLTAGVSMSTSGVSRLVDRLMRQGLVTREFSPDDRRSVLVTLTDAGGEVARAGRAAEADYLRRTVLSKFDGLSLERLKLVFEAIAASG